jgi:hypothetical protein
LSHEDFRLLGPAILECNDHFIALAILGSPALNACQDAGDPDELGLRRAARGLKGARPLDEPRSLLLGDARATCEATRERKRDEQELQAA